MRFFQAPVMEQQRRPLFPHKIISGSLPGATEIRIGGDENIKISGKDQNITITTDDGTIKFGRKSNGTLALEVADDDGTAVGLGVVPGTVDELGFYATDTSGDVVQKIVGATRFILDPSTGDDVSQDGLLPDDTIGRADAKDGESVSGAIT